MGIRITNYIKIERPGKPGNVRRLKNNENRFYARATYNKIVYSKICATLDECEFFIEQVLHGNTEGGLMNNWKKFKHHIL